MEEQTPRVAPLVPEPETDLSMAYAPFLPRYSRKLGQNYHYHPRPDGRPRPAREPSQHRLSTRRLAPVPYALPREEGNPPTVIEQLVRSQSGCVNHRCARMDASDATSGLA
jgi:hypothetical protein